MSTWTDRNLGWLLWPLQSFDQQFLRSDVIGNYSRPYSWQANQLGHATIGLTTTLIFAWMTQHLLDSAELTARHYRTVLSKFELPAVGAFGNLGAYLFLALLIVPVLAIASRQIGALLHERATRRAVARGAAPPAAPIAAFGALSRWLWVLTSILAGLLMGLLGWVEIKTRPPAELQSSVTNGLASMVIFLTAFIAVMVVISKMFRRIFDTDGLPSPDDVLIDGPRSRYGEIRMKASYVAARIGLVTGLILGIFLVTYLFGHAFGVWDGNPPRVFAQMSNRLETAVVVMVAVTFAALAALESRTPHYTILSWLTIGAAALMFDDTALLAFSGFSLYGLIPSPIEIGQMIHADAPYLFASCANAGGGPARLTCGEGVALGSIAALALLTVIALMIGKAKTNTARLALLAGFVFFVFFLFIASRSGLNDPAWRQAIAAGLTALAIWWVKEFGNDIVRVDRTRQSIFRPIRTICHRSRSAVRTASRDCVDKIMKVCAAPVKTVIKLVAKFLICPRSGRHRTKFLLLIRSHFCCFAFPAFHILPPDGAAPNVHARHHQFYRKNRFAGGPAGACELKPPRFFVDRQRRVGRPGAFARWLRQGRRSSA